MTKYILHGGYSRVDNDLNAGYYREITKDLPVDATVLIIPFSREDEEYNDVLEQEKKKLLNSTDNKQLKIQLASKDNFIEQIKESDALVIKRRRHYSINRDNQTIPRFCRFYKR